MRAIGFLLATTAPQAGLAPTQSPPQLLSIHEHAPVSNDICKEERIGLSVLDPDDVNLAADCRRQLCAQIDNALQARIAHVHDYVDVARRCVGSCGCGAKEQSEADVLLRPKGDPQCSHQRP